MKNLARFSLYIIILLVYNFTALYTGNVHDHEFTWTHEDDCPAYIISTTQNSDTFSFSIDHNLCTYRVDYFCFQTLDFESSLEINENILSRAPPLS